jgi:hypothetical protein
VTQKDLDVDINTKLKGIHVKLISGRETELSIDDISGRAKGKAFGASFGAEVERGKTGKVTILDGWVFMPELGVGSIAVNALDYDTPSYRLRVQPGGLALFQNLKANVTIQPYVPPEAKDAKPGKPAKPKEPPAFKRIIVQEMTVPTTALMGMELTLKNKKDPTKGYVISTPLNVPGKIENLRLKPLSPGGDGLIIEFNESTRKYETFGGFGFDTASIGQVTAAKIGSVLKATGDLKLTNFGFDFLGEGKNRWRLEELEVSDLEAELGGSLFIVTGGKVVRGQTAGLKTLKAKGLRQDETGRILADSLTAQNFVYRNLANGLTLTVEDADLPRGFTQAGNALRVPFAKINKAHIHLDDVMKLAGGGPSAKKGDFDYLENLLSTMGGGIDATLFVDTRLSAASRIGLRQELFPLKIAIVRGAFNYGDFEDQLLGYGLDPIVDFEIEDDKLVLQVVVKNLVEFPLTPGEKKLAERKWVKIVTLLTPNPMASSSGGPIKVVNTEWRDIKANLHLVGESVLDLAAIPKSTVTGKIHFGTATLDAAPNLTVTGSGTAGVSIGLDQLNAWAEGVTVGGAKVSTGLIQIGPVRGAKLSFDGLMPKEFDGNIDSATARDIDVLLPED